MDNENGPYFTFLFSPIPTAVCPAADLRVQSERKGSTWLVTPKHLKTTPPKNSNCGCKQLLSSESHVSPNMGIFHF